MTERPHPVLEATETVADYFARQHRAEDRSFLPTLEWVRRKAGLLPGPWRRAPLGRNVVFLLADHAVVKLVPPCWGEADAAREAAALECAAQLALATPPLIASGVCQRSAGWSFVVMGQLRGRQIGWGVDRLAPPERVELARQQGLLARQLGQVPGTDALRALSSSWAELLARQRRELVEALTRSGLPAHLVAAADDYVDEAGDLAAHDDTFVHGDLAVQNLVLSPANRPVEVTGLFDFSDSCVGPAEHELISPVTNQLHRDQAALAAFWQGAGLDPTEKALQHRVMARSMLWYADELGTLVRQRLGSWPSSWPELAATWCTGRPAG